jgi:hypothetical protein
MNNEQKANLYHTLLVSHDKLDGKISDIKAEAAGMEMNEEQKRKIELLERQKADLVLQAQRLLTT